MVDGFVQPSTFHLKGSSSPLVQIINHRIAKALSFCVLTCLAFSFFPRINVGSQFRPLTDRTVLNVSICRFEKVVECFENSPTF